MESHLFSFPFPSVAVSEREKRPLSFFTFRKIVSFLPGPQAKPFSAGRPSFLFFPLGRSLPPKRFPFLPVEVMRRFPYQLGTTFPFFLSVISPSLPNVLCSGSLSVRSGEVLLSPFHI